MVAADLEVDECRKKRQAEEQCEVPGGPLRLHRALRRASGLQEPPLRCAGPLPSYPTGFVRVRHDCENVLIVRLAAPPSAPTDVPDAQPGLIMNPPYERLFDCNSSFRYGCVMQPAQSGRMLDGEGHEAVAFVDCRTSLVVEQEIATDTNALRYEEE